MPSDACSGAKQETQSVLCCPTFRCWMLSCQALVSCCCFSPQKASLAFAGGEDGSVVLWDLREPSTLHRPLGGEGEARGRAPTFSTAGIPQLGSHQAPVISISALSASSHSFTPPGTSLDSSHSSSHSSVGGATEEEDLAGLSFQLASLDRSGLLKLWVIVELASPDPSGSDSDLGLAPGGRVKLVKSASVNLASSLTRQVQRVPPIAAGLMQAHCLQFRPRDTNHIYVGTDTGCVLHHTRYGHRAIPRLHLPPDPHSTVEGGGGVCDVSTISFSPWQTDHFLVGCSNGSIRIYHTKRAPPIHCWPNSTNGIPISTIMWAGHCPGLFLVLDISSHIYVWDILENDSQPVFNQKLKSSVTFCTLTSSVHHSPSLLLAYRDGPMELHSLKMLAQDSQLASQREQLLVENFSTKM